MGWLITAGIVCLLAVVALLFFSKNLRQLGDLLNKPVMSIDAALNSVRLPLGIVLVIAGGWIVSVAFSYPSLWYFYLIGGLIIFFGLLYLFLPQWLGRFSRFCDQVLFSTDELVLGPRKSFGIIIIIIIVVAVYIFYAAYLAAK